MSTLLILPDISDVDPAWAVLLVIGWIVWEVYAPVVLGKETRLSPLIGLPAKIDSLQERVHGVEERVEAVDEKQVHHIQVTRAQARALDDDKDVTMSSDEVDEYLVDNGIPVALLTRPVEETRGDSDVDFSDLMVSSDEQHA